MVFTERLAAETVAERLSAWGALDVAESKKGTFMASFDGIRFTWLYYPNPLLGELILSSEISGLSLASIVDIALAARYTRLNTALVTEFNSNVRVNTKEMPERGESAGIR